jgi:predicted nucleic acid-binding protein
VRFWDSSAIVPLLVDEPLSEQMARIRDDDSSITTWWGSAIECASAIARKERDPAAIPARVTEAFERLRQLQQEWQEVQPVDVVREQAVRLLRSHDLHAADALQLAAAIIAARNRPVSLPFVCLDTRLAVAAEREGFNVIVA